MCQFAPTGRFWLSQKYTRQGLLWWQQLTTVAAGLLQKMANANPDPPTLYIILFGLVLLLQGIVQTRKSVSRVQGPHRAGHTSETLELPAILD